jgi:toxin ParE1/3/4
MKSLRYARAARADLDEIYSFIAKQSVEAADRVLALLRGKAYWLRSHSELGAVEQRYGVDLRISTIGNYAIYYQASKTTVQIVRVLHGARDRGPLLDEE